MTMGVMKADLAHYTVARLIMVGCVWVAHT